MAQIVINEHSQNYTYNIGSNAFATVALPITACWGPGLEADSLSKLAESTPVDDMYDVIDGLRWERFPANQEGLEAFVATYRGPSSNYRLAKDNSYQMAMSLLTAGYDILVCRVSPGGTAEITVPFCVNGNILVKAKYAGTFGNALQVRLKQINYGNDTSPNYAYNMVVYVKDTSGIVSAIENISFTVGDNYINDNIVHIDEVESRFVALSVDGVIDAEDEKAYNTYNAAKLADLHILSGGTDTLAEGELDTAEKAQEYAKNRYGLVGQLGDNGSIGESVYLTLLENILVTEGDLSDTTVRLIANHEWKCYAAMLAYELLKDKLAYNNERMICPWDDQCVSFIDTDATIVSEDGRFDISPMHIKLMDVGYHSRCATPMLDIPKGLPRKYVHIAEDGEGYAQKLARYTPANAIGDINTQLYATHSALFAPWGQYRYAGTSRLSAAPPSFMALMIQRAMILNQAIQYEWALPTNRSHNLNFGKLDYEVSKKLLDKWQTLEGVGVNVITKIPDLGTCLWGNSTLMEVPPATYNALANLSTRYLINAVENVVYK